MNELKSWKDTPKGGNDNKIDWTVQTKVYTFINLSRFNSATPKCNIVVTTSFQPFADDNV